MDANRLRWGPLAPHFPLDLLADSIYIEQLHASISRDRRAENRLLVRFTLQKQDSSAHSEHCGLDPAG
jgi:hypothetical protein